MPLPSSFSPPKFACGLLLGLLLGGCAGTALLLHHLWQRLPSVDHLADFAPAMPLRIHARDGTLLAEYGQERREVVPLERIPVHVQQALLAIEDTDFHRHRGVDVRGIARAAWSNAMTGRTGQGASTITMQVARTFFLTRDKTYSRKLAEVLLAYKLERAYDKDKLLELYMNQVYLGERAYGFAAAASVYFDKPLDQLTVAEAAMLAGLPKAPSAYNPVANRERAVLRQHYILQRLHALGHLDAAGYRQALAEPLRLRPPTPSIRPQAAHAVEQVRQAM
ncbi:MAG: penicillin-binding protein, partial [Comamonadaceae bacterium]